MKIGFIGLGRMGRGVCENFVRHGHDVAAVSYTHLMPSDTVPGTANATAQPAAGTGTELTLSLIHIWLLFKFM